MYKDMMDTIGMVNAADPELGAAMERELTRQRENIELIASENIVSPAVMAAMGSVLTNKYAEGLPGKRYYGGCVYVDEVENIAIAARLPAVRRRVRQRPAPFRRTGQPCRVLCAAGAGRYRHGHGPFAGRPPDPRLPGEHVRQKLPLRLLRRRRQTAYIDYAELEKQARKVQPQADGGGRFAPTPAPSTLRSFAEIAHGYGAYLMVDMAHIAGLVAGGQHQSPVPYADVVTTTTHKTLRGPRGGLILDQTTQSCQAPSTRPVFPGTQGGPLEHVIAAKAVCFGEALKPEFKEYARTDRRKRTGTGRRRLQQRGVQAWYPAAPTTT